MMPPHKKRSRRLRKKLHIGEFQELGFNLEAELKFELSTDAYIILLDSFITELIEPRSLAFCGVFSDGFIAYWGRGSASEIDRKAVESWLLARPEFNAVSIGPLTDSWYSFD